MSDSFMRHSIPALCLCAWMTGCTSVGDTVPGTAVASGKAAGSSRISECKSTDTQIDSSSQCLQDDAACYELRNGKWCTGERGNICPAGSVALPAGQPCPPGNRCFRVGESLECTIN
ncbi:MAG: hypothetical protein HKN42_01510 [Granulosicoccus sp.]|nr:hypothetical protein [Granulosicoccus sp.]